MLRVILIASLAILVATALSAQPNPGDVILLGRSTPEVRCLSPQGVVSTLATLPVGHLPCGICCAQGNRGVAIVTRAYSPSWDTTYLLELRGGVFTTLGIHRTPISSSNGGFVSGVVRDQRGDYIVCGSPGVIRLPGVGWTGTTIATPLADPSGIAESLRGGGWVVISNNMVHQLSRAGVLTTPMTGRLHPSFTVNCSNPFADPTTGDTFLPCDRLYRFNSTTQTVTTLSAGLAGAICGDVDPPNRTLVVGTTTGVYRLARTGQVLSTLLAYSGPKWQAQQAMALTVYGSAQVSPAGLFRPGTASSVMLAFPSDGLRFYQLGASTGISPGIPTSAGVIPLNPDPLLALSLLGSPSLFPGFAGKLDAQGNALAGITLPALPALKGFVFYLAALTHDGAGRIWSISEPEVVVVE
jgi:hypothetical protein